MASFYRTSSGLIHEDAFENDACPSPESRRAYRGIEDLEPGDVVWEGSDMIRISAEMIEAARTEKVQRT